VGRSLRNALPQLGAAMRALRGVPVHMLSEATEDLNLSFVVDEEHADRLVAGLHAELLEGPASRDDAQFGPACQSRSAPRSRCVRSREQRTCALA
jgi:diaminopimelate decarboxylase/aspartate kinase